MKTQFEDAARDVGQSVKTEVQQAGSAFQSEWAEAKTGFDDDPQPPHVGMAPAGPQYKHPKKRWRLKRGATPQWYKQRQGIRTRAQSGAARVSRFRPSGTPPR